MTAPAFCAASSVRYGPGWAPGDPYQGGPAVPEPYAAYPPQVTEPPPYADNAGPAYPPDEYPDAIANANHVGGDEAHDWGYDTQDHLGLGHDVTAVRGKVLGGSSAVNAAVG